MDEKGAGDAQTLYDISGNENNGTTEQGGNGTGMDCTKPGKYGSACEFDGTDDYVNIPDSESIHLNNFTLGLWMYPTLYDGTYETILSKRDTYETMDWNLFTYESPNEFDMYVGESDTAEQLFANLDYLPPLNEWTYISVAKNGTVYEFFADGVSQGTDTTSVTWTDSDSLYIGCTQGTTDFYNGLLDEIKIYNYPRTSEQIIEDMNAGHPAGGSPVGSPVAYWKFDEGFGDTAYDELGNSDGTLEADTGGSQTTETEMWDLNGKFGKAIEFDGTDDKVTIADSSLVSGFPGRSTNGSLDDFTLSAWVNWNALPNYTGIIEKYNATWGESSYRLEKSWDDTIVFQFVNNDDPDFSCIVNSDTQVSTGNWYHVMGVYDKSEIKIYIDGIEDGAPVSCSYDVLRGVSDLKIGDRNDDNTMDGLIDEVKIYNYAMTAAQVNTEFNQGKSLVMGSSGADSSGNPTNAASGEFCIPGDTTTCNPPIGEWKFDEKSGTTAFDTSGSGNDGTLGAGTAQYEPSWARGKLGSALSFDGTDDYISTGLSSTADLTYEVWAKPNAAGLDPGFNTILEAGTDDPWFGILTDKLAFYRESPSRVGTTTLVTETWYHLVLTHDGSTGILYINGVEELNVADSSSSTGSNTGIGLNSADPDLSFGGIIDNIRIYDYARTPAQIAWDFNKGKPIAHWRMDEMSGITVHDESGNGNDGTMTNMEPATDWVSGRNQGALDFDGGDDYVNMGSDSSIDDLGPMTISLWTYINSGGSGEAFISKNTTPDTSNGAWHFSLISDGRFEFSKSYDATALVRRSYYGQLPFQEWVHLTIIWDGSTNSEGGVTYYVNGKIGTTQGVRIDGSGNKLSDAALDLYIGRSSNYFNGTIDDVKIFNYGLTQEQVRAEYTSGAASFR